MSTHDPYPSYRLDPADFSPEAMDAIERVENLPYSQAFEQVLYDHLLHRQTSYSADNPIVFTPILRKERFPHELEDLFIFQPATTQFDNVVIAQLTDSSLVSEILMKFTVSGREFRVYTEDDHAHYNYLNDSGDTVHEVLSRQSTIALIAALNYAAQVATDKTRDEMKLAKDPLIIERPGDSSFVERMLLTLGDINGKTTIETSSLFATDDGILSATLRQTENPYMSGLNNFLDLEAISPNSTISTRVRQHGVNTISVNEPRLENQFAQIELASLAQSDPTTLKHTIDPHEEPEAWAGICAEFYSLVRPLLGKYEAAEEDGLAI